MFLFSIVDCLSLARLNFHFNVANFQNTELVVFYKNKKANLDNKDILTPDLSLIPYNAEDFTVIPITRI